MRDTAGRGVGRSGQFVGALLCAGALAAGCSSGSTPPAGKPGEPGPAGAAQSGPEATPIEPALVRLGPIDKAGFEAFLQRQSGKVVLVDFWATWCVPCVEGFGHTVDLHRRLGDKGLVVVAVSMDDPDHEAQVRKFLAGKGASFENFIAASPPDPFTAFEISGGALPHYKIYGRDGRLRKAIGTESKTVTAREIDRAVEEALAER